MLVDRIRHTGDSIAPSPVAGRSDDAPATLTDLPVVVATIGLLGAVVLMVPFIDGWVRSVVSEYVYPGVALAAGLLIVRASRTKTEKTRLAWGLIGAGVISVGMGDVVWSVYEWTLGDVPYPGYADLFYLASYPLWFAGVFILPHSRCGPFTRRRAALDALVGTLALGGITWTLIVGDLATFEGASLLEQVVTAAYPIADGVLLVALMMLALRRKPRRRDWRTTGLAVALLLTAAADILYLIGLGDYESGVWYDGLWLLSYAVFAAVAVAVGRVDRPSEPSLKRARMIEVGFAFGVLIASVAIALVTLAGDEGVAHSTIIVLGASGLVATFVLIRLAIDVSETKALVEQERRDLLASVSHELRTPLTVIQGYAELLWCSPGEFDESDRDEMLTSVVRESRNLGRVVTDLIELSRGDLGHDRLRLETVELDVVVDEALSVVGEISPVVSVDTGGIRLVADRERLIAALGNLLLNGSKYGGRQVTVRARIAHSQVVIEVHDDGPGVPEEYRAIIWERFERGVNRLNASVPGMGVGLAIVRGIVEAHGGVVQYRPSDLLDGACFVLVLPQWALLERPYR